MQIYSRTVTANSINQSEEPHVARMVQIHCENSTQKFLLYIFISVFFTNFFLQNQVFYAFLFAMFIYFFA